MSDTQLIINTINQSNQVFADHLAGLRSDINLINTNIQKVSISVAELQRDYAYQEKSLTDLEASEVNFRKKLDILQQESRQHEQKISDLYGQLEAINKALEVVHGVRAGARIFDYLVQNTGKILFAVGILGLFSWGALGAYIQ